MSRIGKNPVYIPDKVQAKLANNIIAISGPKGDLSFAVKKYIKIKIDNDKIIISRLNDSKKQKSMHGTVRQIINNMVIGVSKGFQKELTIIGIGYQATMQGKRLQLQLGFSHDIIFELPEGINVTANRTELKVDGIDKQLVGLVAAKIRSFRKPEPYKGKGIRYKNEYVASKQGKTVGTK